MTFTALGTPNRATIGLVVFVFEISCLLRSIIGSGGVADLDSTGLFLPFDLTATGLALPRIAVWAGMALTIALPR